MSKFDQYLAAISAANASHEEAHKLLRKGELTGALHEYEQASRAQVALLDESSDIKPWLAERGLTSVGDLDRAGRAALRDYLLERFREIKQKN